jgi:hypothetical protein|tara:strand:- start:132 stop:443 length:312 start_codon:yes stop_codon:yes gene_type:complete
LLISYFDFVLDLAFHSQEPQDPERKLVFRQGAGTGRKGGTGKERKKDRKRFHEAPALPHHRKQGKWHDCPDPRRYHFLRFLNDVLRLEPMYQQSHQVLPWLAV